MKNIKLKNIKAQIIYDSIVDAYDSQDLDDVSYALDRCKMIYKPDHTLDFSIVDSLVENTEIRLVSHKSFVDGITRIFIGLKYKDQVFHA